MIRLAIRHAPPIGPRPRWITIEHRQAEFPRLAWLLEPWRRLELWRYRRRRDRLRAVRFRPDRADAE